VVRIKTAPRLDGPWSAGIVAFPQLPGYGYGARQHDSLAGRGGRDVM